MSFVPHVHEERQRMLEAVGVASVEDLFEDIPPSIRNPRLDLPPPLSELEAVEALRDLEALNRYPVRGGDYFIGGGAYNHHVPAAVDAVASIPSFYTAYTPYQAEASQGMLQAMFEYQTAIARITGLDVSNASLYDGGTASYEACALAMRQTRRRHVLFDRSVNPHYRELLTSYAHNVQAEITELEYAGAAGDAPGRLAEKVDESVAAVVVQNPDFFGRIADYSALAEAANSKGALLVMIVNPVSLGILKTPGEMGADVAVGEGQPLGLRLNYGGPYLGFMAARRALMRKMPGRLVGETVDAKGRRAFVLTLQAREQHIRREKATSNICSNEALCALTAVAHLATIGRQGFVDVSKLCLQKAHYARMTLGAVEGAELVFDGPHFNEFVLRLGRPVEGLFRAMGHSFELGIRLNRWYGELSDCLLVAVTEVNSKLHIDEYARRLRDWLCN
ncbi:MAG: aminomethyl-transferring glycine dehydrogenase subunit GcvPA [Planctomycetota bacterium]|jgi:glycine dehydrogenase subunit 1